MGGQQRKGKGNHAAHENAGPSFSSLPPHRFTLASRSTGCVVGYVVGFLAFSTPFLPHLPFLLGIHLASARSCNLILHCIALSRASFASLSLPFMLLYARFIQLRGFFDGSIHFSTFALAFVPTVVKRSTSRIHAPHFLPSLSLFCSLGVSIHPSDRLPIHRRTVSAFLPLIRLTSILLP